MIVLHRPATGPCRPTVHISPDVPTIAGELLAGAIERTIARQGRCRLALSGGSTPAPIFAWLRQNLPTRCYDQLHITWADERVLPCNPSFAGDWQAFDPESNLRLAYEKWLAHVPIDVRRVHPLALSADAKVETLRFGRSFRQEMDGEIDVALLGVGPDGHVASLFPDHPALDVDDLCMAVHDSPKPPAERITLSLPVLDRARVVVVAATGDNKADMLSNAFAGVNGGEGLPVARVRGGGDLHWVLDPAAGRQIAAAAISK
ncbi:MAG: 6-phosphogluconolactonase [Myxococcales bacterium]|nr:6-phosphogluconolactonase [Myxococcales bacterium]